MVAVVPAVYTFVPADNGVHVFTAGGTLVTAGIQSITATDTLLNALTVSAVVSVGPAAATHFAVIGPAFVQTNTAFDFTVTAKDPFGNSSTGYNGVVDFASSDSQALLPTNTSLNSGVGVFSATFETEDLQTVTATDSANAAITGSAVTIAFNSPGVAPFVQSINTTDTPAVTNASSVNFTVTFNEPVMGVGPADFQLARGGTVSAT